MSSERVVLRGGAAVAARSVRFGAQLTPSEVLATGPWADAYHEARADAERAGYWDGRAEGRRAGAVEGRHDVVARAASALDALDRAADRLARTDASTVTDLAPRVVELALELAGLILQREVAASAEPAREAILRVLPALPERGELVVRLHPEDHRALGDGDDLVPGRHVTLVADPTLGRGDAVADVGPCRVESRLDEALARVGRALRGQEATS